MYLIISNLIITKIILCKRIWYTRSASELKHVLKWKLNQNLRKQLNNSKKDVS